MIRLLPLLLLLAACAPAAPPLDPAPAAPASAERPAIAEHPVIYELFLRSFTEEGTFRAAIDRLDEVRDLGVTTVWLMPIHPIGQDRMKGPDGSPYSIADYTAVNPEHGTMEDFRAFVDAAHARGMTVILDLVANHTAWDHPWITEHPEWYQADDDGTIVHPPGTDWTDVAQLDFSNPELREAMRAAMRFWVEEGGIDGYRADVAEMVPNDFWSEAIAELRAIRPVLMLAEGARLDLHEAGFDLTYDWETYNHMKNVWRGESAATLADHLAAEPALPNDGRRLRFTTNHDETAWDDTPLGLFGGSEGARAAAALATLLPGVPLVYNGQEVGDTQRLHLFDPTPIRWDADPAMRTFYTDLLALRAERPALHAGTMEMLAHDAPEAVVAFRRTAPGDTATVLVNTRPEPVTVTLDGEAVALDGYGWRVD